MATTHLTLADFSKKAVVGTATVFGLDNMVSSTLGPVCLEIEVVSPKAAIEAGHLALASSLLRHFHNHERQISDRLYRSYLATDDAWLEKLGIPSGRTPDSVMTLVSGLRLSVALPADQDDEEYLRFYARPAWDEEHGFYLSPDPDEGWLAEEY